MRPPLNGVLLFGVQREAGARGVPMPSELIEKTRLSTTLDSDAEDGVDERWVRTLQTVYAITEVYQQMRTAQQNGVPLGGFLDQEYADELAGAFYVGQELLERDDRDQIREDMSQLDAETLAEVRGSIGYVAPHLGIDLDLPAPSTESDE